MKEYIGREEFLKRLLDNLEKALYYSQLIETVDIPIADVVEKEKIEKAIEEMGELASQHISLDQKDAIDMCIRILKRNIER